MPAPVDAILVPVADLQLMRAALNSAYHHNQVLDLADQYRKLHQRPQGSKLTGGLQAAHDLVLSYIELALTPEEAPETDG